jgi:hypothetical protein
MPVEFHLSFNLPSFEQKITLSDRLFLIGSCFTNHLHDKLEAHKFRVLQNPHGILFNPISICNSLDAYINKRLVTKDQLFQHQSLWHHWDFHSSYSNEDPENALDLMNKSIVESHEFLKNTEWIFITLGSAFAYLKEDREVVANCHKLPSDVFSKELLKPNEIASRFIKILQDLMDFNKKINIVFTVSPVRHLRDGFIENNRSKASLIHAIDLIKDQISSVEYFPAYELVIDDLRDYRFYAEDMVHPNYLATQYVWEKFVESCVEGKSQEAMKEINQLQQAVKHRPLHPSSTEHLKFKQKSKDLALELSKRFPFLDFSKEIMHFT